MYLTLDDIRTPWLFVRNLPLGWCQRAAQDTLRMFDQNPKIDPKTTPYYRVSVAMVSKKKWWHGAKTAADCVKRTQYLVTLRRSIERNGIKDVVHIHIKNNGKIFVQDGYHRLFCADYIGYKKAIPVKVTYVGPSFQAIVKLLLKLGKGSKVTYHPLYDRSSALYHPYFRDWRAWRTDCSVRYRAILAKLNGVRAVLDIGPCEGYFSINLAARGYKVTAVELHPDRAKVLKFFASLRGVQVPITIEDWRSYCARTEGEFDAILLLGTFHHQLIHDGPEEFKKLGLLRTKKLFLEIATNRDPRMTKFPTLSNAEIVRRVLKNTKFTRWEKVYASQHPYRSDGFMFT